MPLKENLHAPEHIGGLGNPQSRETPFSSLHVGFPELWEADLNQVWEAAHTWAACSGPWVAPLCPAGLLASSLATVWMPPNNRWLVVCGHSLVLSEEWALGLGNTPWEPWPCPQGPSQGLLLQKRRRPRVWPQSRQPGRAPPSTWPGLPSGRGPRAVRVRETGHLSQPSGMRSPPAFSLPGQEPIPASVPRPRSTVVRL